ncbi:BRCA1-A complex subunit Abraxas 1 [Limanda limanda]|uniref:BRCA1-A complex subunit Abraxas 1 n=1 Tax=Limanda limanda TaxID=27771 RepID=UPI0029C974A0|nr:BRCA1-A complex subunit Abraxas 1 [Limanda limanda]
MAEPIVRASGIVLSSLMFQHLNSDSDADGLLLGRISVEEQVTISDSQADHIHIEEIYNIQKHMTCPRLSCFYNSVGDVNMEELHKVLADNKQENVIGWYRQRRNTDQRMTFREKIVHENLKTCLSNPHVLFVLLASCKVRSSGSTHQTEYGAFISRSRTFLNVPIRVTNLGSLEQQAYWKESTSCSAAGYNLTMEKHGAKFFSSNGLLREVNEVNKMNDSLQVELQKACREVEESESLLETLQADVSQLRRRVREKRQKEAGKKTVSDPSEHRDNLLLREALAARFPSSPLFHTQTLTLEGFPVPVVCGAKRHEHVSTISKCDAPDSSGKRPGAGEGEETREQQVLTGARAWF